MMEIVQVTHGNAEVWDSGMSLEANLKGGDQPEFVFFSFFLTDY